MGAVPIVMLSWNTARLLALVLNCFSGLMQYYHKEQLSNSLDIDAVLALRLMQGHLRNLCELNTSNANGGFHPAIFSTIRNLSYVVGDIVERALLSSKARENDQSFSQFKPLLDKAQHLAFNPHRKLDERLRWDHKAILDRDKEHESGSWFSSSTHLHICISSLISKNCELSPKCTLQFLTSKGLIGYDISRQVLFVFLAQMVGCGQAMEKMLKKYDPRSSLKEFVSERCTNIHDEIVKFRRDKKKLARIINPSLDLLMEQVFVCLQHGYLEFANPHTLVAALAWQHPVLGCYTLQRPESLVNLGLSSGLNLVSANQSSEDGTCLLHTSSVIGLGVSMFLRFLLDPGPWPELRFVDQLVQIDTIVAEDHFQHFKYIDWVRDSNFLYEIRGMPRPPPMAWSPDLVAFMILLFFFIVGSVVAHHLFTSNRNGRVGKVKQMYPYSFKKL